MAMSIKKRIVLWYALWMLLILVLSSVILVFAYDYAIGNELMNEMLEVFDDVYDTYYERGGLGGIPTRDDGVIIVVRDNDGSVLRGRVPFDFPLSRYSESLVSSGNYYYLDGRISEDLTLRLIVPKELSNQSSISIALILVFLPLIVILSSVGGYLIVRKAFKPLYSVVSTSRMIAESGDLSNRVGLSDGSEEMVMLSSAFDDMIRKLEVSFERERQFADDVSHELRTPLAALISETEYAKTLDKSGMENSLEKMSAIERRLSRLCSQLLELSRADRDKIVLEKESVDLKELVEATLLSFKEEAGKKNITLSLSGVDEAPFSGDRDQLTRLFINLISNAIRYGREGGHIDVYIGCDEGHWMVRVEDDGIGIGKENIGKVFDRFFQEDRSRNSKGLGLGLSISKWIAEAHGGRIEAKSEKGKGSTFTLFLPA